MLSSVVVTRFMISFAHHIGHRRARARPPLAREFASFCVLVVISWPVDLRYYMYDTASGRFR